MARPFFHPERGIWRLFGYVGEIVMLSLLWGVCCIPLVTIGTSTTALYDTVVHVIRRREDELFPRFFRTFRAELKTGTLSTLLWAAVLAALYFVFRLIHDGKADTPQAQTLSSAYFVLLLFFLLLVLCWVFPLLSRFRFRVLPLNVTALRLAFGNILRSVPAALLTLGGIVLCYLFTTPLIFVPGLTALLWSYLMEPVFQKYDGSAEQEME